MMGMSRSTGGSAAPAAGGGGGGNIIGGALSFGGGGYFPTDLSSLSSAYSSAYNAALQANQQNYNNILTGYQQLSANQKERSDYTERGYTDLVNSVLGRISNTNSSNIRDINNLYAQQRGTAGQQLTSAGLNNTTVVEGVNRGIYADQAAETTRSNNSFAQLMAQYEASLGSQKLDFINQASQQATGLGVQQLNWMNSVDIPYPDMGAYAQLAAVYGQQDQADKDRALYDQILGGMSGNSGMGGGGLIGAPGASTRAGGYMPSFTSSGYVPLTGAGGGDINNLYAQQQAPNPIASTVAKNNNMGGYYSPYQYIDTTPNYDLEGYF